MSEPFELWGQRGRASVEAVGESHFIESIRTLFGFPVKPEGDEITVPVGLLPEPLNPHDRNAVGVWAGTGQIGYLSRRDAARYAPVLAELVARGRIPHVAARVWAATDHGRISGSVRLHLGEPHTIVPANRPPGMPHLMLPVGAAIQVTGEERHLGALSRWLRPDGECWVHATLHEIAEDPPGSDRVLAEVRIDGAVVGRLTPRMSGELLPVIRHLAAQDQVTAVRAEVKGNQIKTEVILYSVRAHELPAGWPGGRAHSPAIPEQRPRADQPITQPMAPFTAASAPPQAHTASHPLVPAPVPAPAPAPAGPAWQTSPVAQDVTAMGGGPAAQPGSASIVAPPRVTPGEASTVSLKASPIVPGQTLSRRPPVPEDRGPDALLTGDHGPDDNRGPGSPEAVAGGSWSRARFNPPPNWPPPPPGWHPPAGWTPDPSWGEPPPGWRLWLEGAPEQTPAEDTGKPGTQTAAAVSATSAKETTAAEAVASGPRTTEIPVFGARTRARELAAEVDRLREEGDRLRADNERLRADAERYRGQLDRLGVFEVGDLQNELAQLRKQLDDLRQQVVVTEDLALLQEAGVYRYRHPLSDAVGYRQALAALQEQIAEAVRTEGGAVRTAQSWIVNGSGSQGRLVLADHAKLMLRAYNAEADNLVSTLQPYQLPAAIDRLGRMAATIARLGETMDIRITDDYHRLRVRELGLTADYQEKLAEEREREGDDRARLHEEQRLRQEIDGERARLDQERLHFANALAALRAHGDEAGSGPVRERLQAIDDMIADVDYRAGNARAGYVYVLSNLGAFGENMIKIGMTRRLDPMGRLRELGDGSVPFGFDVHALFFADDAAGIEAQLHARFAGRRVNRVDPRREFFYATPAEAKQHLMDLTGNLLRYEETAPALEFRRSQVPSHNG